VCAECVEGPTSRGGWAGQAEVKTRSAIGNRESCRELPGAAGPSSDPQTVEELMTVGARTVGSGAVPDGSAGPAGVYQNYVTFLSSAVAQLASANLHDYVNDSAAWVTSAAQATPYEVWGDYTLLSGANGGDGVAATSDTAQLSQLSQVSMTQILSEGGTSISLDDIRNHFPTGAGTSASTVTDLATFAASLQPVAVSQFESFWPTLKTVVLRLGSPRLGISSRDQKLGDRWYANLPDTGFTMSETLLVGRRVFARLQRHCGRAGPGDRQGAPARHRRPGGR
jgi:hypothetical protein